jgi:hypothetical protein
MIQSPAKTQVTSLILKVNQPLLISHGTLSLRSDSLIQWDDLYETEIMTDPFFQIKRWIREGRGLEVCVADPNAKPRIWYSYDYLTATFESDRVLIPVDTLDIKLGI